MFFLFFYVFLQCSTARACGLVRDEHWKKDGKNDGSNPAPQLLPQISLGDGAVLLDSDLRIQGSFSAALSGGIVVE